MFIRSLLFFTTGCYDIVYSIIVLFQVNTKLAATNRIKVLIFSSPTIIPRLTMCKKKYSPNLCLYNRKVFTGSVAVMG